MKLKIICTWLGLSCFAFIASDANAWTCIRLADKKQYKLKFLDENFSQVHFASYKAKEMWLSREDHTIIARMIDSNKTMAIAARVRWKFETLHTDTFVFDLRKGQIDAYISDMREGGKNLNYQRYICGQ